MYELEVYNQRSVSVIRDQGGSVAALVTEDKSKNSLFFVRKGFSPLCDAPLFPLLFSVCTHTHSTQQVYRIANEMDEHAVDPRESHVPCVRGLNTLHKRRLATTGPKLRLKGHAYVYCTTDAIVPSLHRAI